MLQSRSVHISSLLDILKALLCLMHLSMSCYTIIVRGLATWLANDSAQGSIH